MSRGAWLPMLSLHATAGLPGGGTEYRGRMQAIQRLTDLRDLMGLSRPFADPLNLKQTPASDEQPAPVVPPSSLVQMGPRHNTKRRSDDKPDPVGVVLVPPPVPTVRYYADDRPVAYMISATSRYTRERQKELEDMGFRPERVDPVYLENDCTGGNDPKKKAMWGIMNAHQNAWKQLAQSGRRGLILESDWGIGSQVRVALARILRPTETGWWADALRSTNHRI